MSAPIVNSKADWRTIGEQTKYFRSAWEANYARWLQYQLEHKMIASWQHEPETFWFPEIKRGVRSYLPDFRIVRADGSIFFAEVKGFMDSKSLTKLKRFKRFYPSNEIVVADSNWFRLNSPKLKLLIPEWEVCESCIPKKKIMAKKKVYI